MDICDELEAKASTVHGGAYSAMMRARKEIYRLRKEVERLTPPPRGPAHSCDIPGCAVCDPCHGL